MADKTIDTLVEDIYNLFSTTEKVEPKEEDLNAFLEGIKQSIVRALSRDRRARDSLRLSMIGQPDRKIWNELKNTPRSDLSGPTLVKFLYGDILEHLLILLTKVAGHTVEDNQKEVEVDGVIGHTDVVIDGVLVDIKSASPHGFRKFKEGSIVTDDPFGYIAQISGYKKALNKDRAGFLAIEKVSGEIVFCQIDGMDFINPSQRISHLRNIISQEAPPPHCYDPVPDGKSGNMKLAVGCTFCDFKKECWKHTNNGKGLRAFNYSTGIRYLTEVNKTPDVEEVKIP